MRGARDAGEGLSPVSDGSKVSGDVDAAFVRFVQEFVDGLSGVRDLKDIEARLEAAGLLLGFRHYALIDHDDHIGLWAPGRGRADLAGSGRIFMQNYPPGYSEQYVAGRFHRIDPVVHACHVAAWSFCWSDMGDFLRLTPAHRAFLERGARVGVRDGITTPFQIFGERGGSCNFSGRISGPASTAADLDRIRALRWITQSIGIFAYTAARRIAHGHGAGGAPGGGDNSGGNGGIGGGICGDGFGGGAVEGGANAAGPPPRSVRAVPLGPRERECVILASQGKTNKEIARDLGIAPSTVKQYLGRVSERYDGAHRCQTAWFAALDGEIGVHEVLPPCLRFLAK